MGNRRLLEYIIIKKASSKLEVGNISDNEMHCETSLKQVLKQNDYKNRLLSGLLKMKLLVFRRLYDKKQYIGIYVYADHISFINHNIPLPPVTIEDMNCEDEFRERNYLNPEIKEMFCSTHGNISEIQKIKVQKL